MSIPKKSDAKVYSIADLAGMNEYNVYCPHCKQFADEGEFRVELEPLAGHGPGMLVCPSENCNLIIERSVIRKQWFYVNEKNELILSIPKAFWDKFGWIFDEYARNSVYRRITIGEVIWQAMVEYGFA